MAALGASSMIVVTDAHIRRAQGKLLDAMLAPLTLPRFDVVLAAGEAQKTLGTVATIWDAALGAGIDREAVVFGFGGGVVLDLAGFAAATLLRGLRWLAAPTTLLAMVDASVGGKTGFDHPAGKNLVGAFHQPSAVVADFATLATLPIRERRAGLAEVVKIALAYDAALFQRMEETAEALRDGDDGALFPVVSAAILAKTRVVRADEREHGERVILNLGHTVGHALEAHGGFTRWLHGEAVALGVVAELRAAAALGLGDATIATRTQRLLARLGLPSEPKDLSRDELAAALRWADADKKRRGTHLRLPVIQSLGASSTAPVELERLKSEILRT
jgi:3-dehydroquinate synthase